MFRIATTLVLSISGIYLACSSSTPHNLSSKSADSATFELKSFRGESEETEEESPLSNVNWMTYEQAVAQLQADKAAGQKGKKIFIDIYTDWCGWCKRMDKNTFQQKEISAYLNNNFYPVKLDAEYREDILFAGNTFKYIPQGRRGYHQLAAVLLDGKMSYPTVVFLNEDFQLIQRIPGYLEVGIFDTILHYLAEDHYKKTPWEQFQQEYKSTVQR